MRYSLDIGVTAVEDHDGYLAVEVGDQDDHVEFVAGMGWAGRLVAACSCGWVSADAWLSDAATPGGEPSRILAMEIETAWIRHVYDDVVPADREEAARRLDHLLRRLGDSRRADGPITDIHRDLTAALETVAYLATTGTPQWRQVAMPAQATPESLARAAVVEISALARVEDLPPGRAHQVAVDATQVVDRLRAVVDNMSLSLQRRRVDLYDLRGRDVASNVDEAAYRLGRAGDRLDQAEEHLHRAAHLMAGLRLVDEDDDDY